MNVPDFITASFGLMIVTAGVLASVYHYHRWRDAEKLVKPGDLFSEKAFLANQQRRRFQIGLLGAVGGALLLGSCVLLANRPIGGFIMVAGSMLFITWALMLAMADALSIQMFFGVKRTQILAEKKRLEAEIEEMAQTAKEQLADSSDKSSKSDKH